MSLRKIPINNKIMDVANEDEYIGNSSLFDDYTAIDMHDGYVYPVRNKYDSSVPGYYSTNCVRVVNKPITDEQKKEYSASNIIDFGLAKNFKQAIQESQRLMNAERSILTSIDNKFVPDIGDNDTPEMKAFKQAIIDKEIDLDKYEGRFGVNYNNDKRLLRKSSITLGKLRAISDCLDIKVTMTFEDANPDVPNPIGRTISVVITGDENTEDENG